MTRVKAKRSKLNTSSPKPSDIPSTSSSLLNSSGTQTNCSKTKRPVFNSPSPAHSEASVNEALITNQQLADSCIPLVKVVDIADQNTDIASYKMKVDDIKSTLTKMQNVLQDLAPLSYLFGKHNYIDIEEVKQAEIFLDFISTEVVKRISSLHKAIVYNIPENPSLNKVKITLLKASGMSHVLCECKRLRKKDWQSSCPILFYFRYTQDSAKFIKSVSRIRTGSEYKNVLIVADKTALQRTARSRHNATTPNLNEPKHKLVNQNNSGKASPTVACGERNMPSELSTTPTKLKTGGPHDLNELTSSPGVNQHTMVLETEMAADLIDLDITPLKITTDSHSKVMREKTLCTAKHLRTAKTKKEPKHWSNNSYKYLHTMSRPSPLGSINEPQTNSTNRTKISRDLNRLDNKSNDKPQNARLTKSLPSKLKINTQCGNKRFLSSHPHVKSRAPNTHQYALSLSNPSPYAYSDRVSGPTLPPHYYDYNHAHGGLLGHPPLYAYRQRTAMLPNSNCFEHPNISDYYNNFFGIRQSLVPLAIQLAQTLAQTVRLPFQTNI
ncbi:hypothetical protein MN116_000342 [Schistosoma mekongi]|uniref:Uncharacterized protein n=1 Tax=Schistosoma mekongi TaxID=38744 RepID=A0AAE1Z4S0_SCHME|nr:hypothetical protein MN116_000342 [Schistosoma mekongi]